MKWDITELLDLVAWMVLISILVYLTEPSWGLTMLMYIIGGFLSAK